MRYFVIIFSMMFLLLSCGPEGMNTTYHSDDLGSVRFIKSEKLADVNGEALNCDYGEISHQHNINDSYYIYFTLSSKTGTPVNPSNPRFTNIADSLSVEFQKKIENSSNYELDGNIQKLSKIEFISKDKDLSKEQNFNFLIDVMKSSSCDNLTDKDLCSLSGALTNESFKEMLNKISTSLSNFKSVYDNENSFFTEDKFLGVKYMALSTDATESSWLHRLITTVYLYDMSNCLGSISSTENKKKIDCWLKVEGSLQDPDGIAYRALKSGQTSRFHRKLWDGYIRAAELIKEDTAKNKNLLFFVSGYEEGYYDIDNVLSPNNKSEHTEEDFFTALDTSHEIPVFIAPQNRTDLNSFPETSGNEIDNKFYKLACLTNGAYFPNTYDTVSQTWNSTTESDFSAKGVMGHIKEASYGMWRIKVKINEYSIDRIYKGRLLVWAKDTRGDEVFTNLVGYQIIR